MTSTDSQAQPATASIPPGVLAALHEALERLRFGVVQLIVHEGRVVQLEVTEKHRF